MEQPFVPLVTSEDITPPASNKRGAKMRQYLSTLNNISTWGFGKLNALKVMLKVGLLKCDIIIRMNPVCLERSMHSGLISVALYKK